MLSYSDAALIAMITGAAGFLAGALGAVLIGLKFMAVYDKITAVRNGHAIEDDDQEPDEDDDDPYADLTLRDVDPDAVYATEDDDFYEERVEARDGAAR